MDEDEYPATQLVLPTLLGDVVAYVEVRSGHDNRSRGVISELRSLGASIAPVLNRDVTHVVFQGGHVSTYKKAKQQMCNVVAVSWIEASKELGCKAPEDEHPPPGFEKYEDPIASRKIRVLKSMQPDFDDEKDDERLNAKLARIKRKTAKRSASTGRLSNANGKSEKKKKCTVSDKKNESPTKLSRSLDKCLEGNVNEKKTRMSKRRVVPTAGNVTPPKRTRRNSGGSPSVPGSSTNAYHTDDDKIRDGTVDPKLSNEDGKNGIKSSIQGTSRKSFQLAVPKPVKAVGEKAGPQASSAGNPLIVQTRKSKIENEALKVADLKTKEKQLPLSNINDCRLAQWTPLGFIENISREKDYPSIKLSLDDKSPQRIASGRQTRRSAGAADLIQNNLDPGSKNCPPETTGPNPFVTRVLEFLRGGKKRRFPMHPSSVAPTRQHSPRLSALQKENDAVANGRADSDAVDNIRPQKKTAESRKNVVLNSASAHMLKLWKAKPCRITSPEVRLLDISFSPAKRPSSRDADQSDTDSNANSLNTVETNSSKQDTPVQNDQTSWKQLSQTLNSELTNEDRSDSPILGTRVKHRLLKSVLSRTKSLSGEAPSNGTQSSKMVPEYQGSNCSVASDSVAARTKKRSVQLDENESSLCSAVDSSKIEEKGRTGGLDSSVRSSRWRSRPDGKESSLCSAVDSSNTEEKGRTGGLDSSVRSSRWSSRPDEMESSLCSAVDSSKIEEKGRTGGLDSSVRSSRWRSRPDETEKLPTLVCTYLKGSDVKRVINAVRDLGKFEFEDQVSERTTHLVASGPRRTINMLRGIARGCWILKDAWVYKSVKARRWLREDDFEITEFSPLVQERRLLRQSPNGLGHWDLLSSVGPIFVSPTSQPCPSDLKDLIVLSGGTVSKTVDEAAVIIGPSTKTSKRKNAKPRVAPAWILDCVAKGEKLPFLSPEYTENA